MRMNMAIIFALAGILVSALILISGPKSGAVDLPDRKKYMLY